MSKFEPKELRKALGTFTTGVTIVTFAGRDGLRYGLTANSFSSVSLDPPLVLWSLDKKSSAVASFAQARGFAVHVLASNQEHLSRRFATSAADKFGELCCSRGFDDAPLLREFAARFECEIAQRHDAGDHWIVVGRVVEFQRKEAPPLVFHAGRYAALQGAEHAAG